ncbi:deoxyribose-phosphate aldolase [Paenibacillus methanolicus]|uniref:Deoxyribose-phosphate aldolase n=1 Tax=Paenibacillus methanolicus TaxID=582686 RepID=A0A5S5CFF2_9BACL|nr:deoxyribose-phosphate aldolase [Paenibacillus methanolicus]TYP78027.1 ribokinase/deoxyribose-phosphate aldolase [Paenibacillus methanolicus]
MLEKWEPGTPIAKFIDHTLLKPGATEKYIIKLCEEAAIHQFYSVCVNGAWVSLCREKLADTGVHIAAVVGFPLGAMSTKAKVYEAQTAAQDGASEIDMVLPIGAVVEGRYGVVSHDIASVVRAVEGSAIVKVILETGMLNQEQKAEACRVAEAAGAHYVKTSTGFGTVGATEADIRLMRASVTSRIGVKASGGIRDAETAIRMLQAGANRLGTSAGVAIVNGQSSAESSEGNTAEEQEASTLY